MKGLVWETQQDNPATKQYAQGIMVICREAPVAAHALGLSLDSAEDWLLLVVQDENEEEQASAPAPAPKPKLEANGAFKKTNLRSEENTFKAQEQTR